MRYKQYKNYCSLQGLICEDDDYAGMMKESCQGVFYVYDNDIPAIIKGTIWTNNVFYSFSAALEYVESWLSGGSGAKKLSKNWDGTEFVYSNYGDRIKISKKHQE